MFPTALNLFSCTSVLKFGDLKIASNYRSTIILSNLSKILETIVLNSIRPALNHILVNEHDFKPGCSYELRLSAFIFDIF